MVQERTAEEQPETMPEAMPAGELSKVSQLHIYMPAEAHERIKKWAKYAAIEELIEGHPSGNLTSYCTFALTSVSSISGNTCW